MSETIRTGRCACGQLSYKAEDDPVIVHACHCSACQRECGTAFATNFIIESDKVEMTGEVEMIDTASASGKGQWILRCPTCKVAVSSHYPSAREGLHFLRVGTMDNGREIEPDVHIYTSTKVDWLALPADTPSFDNYYPRRFLSETQMHRWLKAAGK